MANYISSLVILPLYLLLRLLIHSLRNIYWRINGTYSQLSYNRVTEKTESAAHVLNIKWKFKYDVITQSNKLGDFILFHDSFQHEDYILRDEVTLYHVNSKEAVFVESPIGHNVWDMTKYSFSRESQFKTAIKVIILPIKTAQRVAKGIGLPKSKLIFMGNISRCGSTLLCRMFLSTGLFMSYSEPSVISDLQSFEKEDPMSLKLALMTVNLMCKPTIKSNPEGHVIKIPASSTSTIELLYEVFPGADFLFMYRNQLPVMKSLARLVPSLKYFKLYKLLQFFSQRLASRFDQYHNNSLEYPNWEIPIFNKQLKTPYQMVFPISLCPVLFYYKFVTAGMNIKAIRFEDIIQYPEDSLNRIFSICEVAVTYVGKALRPLDKDAHENSVMSGRRLSSYQIPKFTEDDAEEVEKICKWFEIPNVLEEHVLPKTLTVSGTRRPSRRRLLSQHSIA